jgi:hypothetical protein
MFDLSDFDEPAAPNVTHACAGEHCQVCQRTNTGQQAKKAGTASVRRDETWWDAAAQWLWNMPSGTQFTADDLREAVGRPQGSGNQFGACIRSWAVADKILHHGYAQSREKSNHGHVHRVWVKA